MKVSALKVGGISKRLFILGFIFMGFTWGGISLVKAEAQRPQGTVKGKVMATISGVKGAKIYQYVEGAGWKHVATSGGLYIRIRGRYEFTTDAGMHDFKAEWAGRVDIKRNVEVKENPAITELDFHLPLKDE